jgi:hypothetical protein
MDRLDAMKVFIVEVDEGNLAAAGRNLDPRPLRSGVPSPSQDHTVRALRTVAVYCHFARP